jgi:hypothetical protein
MRNDVKCGREQFLRSVSFVGSCLAGRAWRHDGPGEVYVEQAADVWLIVYRLIKNHWSIAVRSVCPVHVAQKHALESAPYAPRA